MGTGEQTLSPMHNANAWEKVPRLTLHLVFIFMQKFHKTNTAGLRAKALRPPRW